MHLSQEPYQNNPSLAYGSNMQQVLKKPSRTRMTFFNAKKKDIASLGGTNSSQKRKEKKKREGCAQKSPEYNGALQFHIVLSD